MALADSGAAQTHVDKWRRREPEMGLLQAFCPDARWPLLVCWAALQNEMVETLMDSSDAVVAQTKLRWWGEDLAAGASGSRHPLGRALLTEAGAAAIAAARWRELMQDAALLGDALHANPRPVLPVAAGAACAQSLASIESYLFGACSDPAAVLTALSVDCLLRRGTDAALLRHTAAALLASAPRPTGPILFRNARLGFDRWRLARLVHGVPLQRLGTPPAWRALPIAWQAARASRRSG